MKKIYFDCTHCEAKRYITINEVTHFYLIGGCPTCRNIITINRKRFEMSLANKAKKISN